MGLRRVTVCFWLVFGVIAAHAQEGGGTTPRAKDGKPDLTGVWNPDGKFSGDFARALKPGEKISVLPAAEKMMKEAKKKNDPSTRCLPMGVPRLSTFPEKIVQTPKEVFILHEGDIHTFRLIYLGDRPHPAELGPSWYGDSIGKWEGDTLVVDTIGFNDRSWLDSVGHPHTEQLHVTERYRRPNAGNLELEVTIEDPGAYAKPFTIAGKFTLVAGKEIKERYCYTSPADK
jgi:hypothetical protein